VLSLAYAAEALAARAGGKALYTRRLRRDRLTVARVDVPIDGLPAALDGFTIAHMSDFHAGPFLDAGSLTDVVDVVREHRPDVIALTGDYITHRADEAFPLAAALARVESRHGGVLVFGNHDYHARREGEIAAAFAAVGIEALRNEGRALEVDGARLWLAGVEDVEEGKVVDLDAALADRSDEDVTVLLSHHPDMVEHLDGRDVDLVLAGHTHGGQIVVGGRSPLGSLRSRYLSGLHSVGDTRLFVTRGLGVLIVPLRIGAPPEVAILTLRA